jgi:hypothetical protein
MACRKQDISLNIICFALTKSLCKYLYIEPQEEDVLVRPGMQKNPQEQRKLAVNAIVFWKRENKTKQTAEYRKFLHAHVLRVPRRGICRLCKDFALPLAPQLHLIPAILQTALIIKFSVLISLY